MHAAWHTHFAHPDEAVEIIKLLQCEHGMVDENKRTALMYAVEETHWRGIECLLDECGVKDESGTTALIQLIESGYLYAESSTNFLKEMIMKEAQIVDNDGKCALDYLLDCSNARSLAYSLCSSR